MAKVPHGAPRPRYIFEGFDAMGRQYDMAGCRVVQDPKTQSPRRGCSGDKLRRKAYEGKL